MADQEQEWEPWESTAADLFTYYRDGKVKILSADVLFEIIEFLNAREYDDPELSWMLPVDDDLRIRNERPLSANETRELDRLAEKWNEEEDEQDRQRAEEIEQDYRDGKIKMLSVEETRQALDRLKRKWNTSD